MAFDYRNQEHIDIIFEILRDFGFKFDMMVSSYEVDDDLIIAQFYYQGEENMAVIKSDVFNSKLREKRINEVIDD